MATLLKVLNNLADIKSARGVALRVRTHAGFTVARFRSLTFSDNPVYRAQRERVYEGMRMAVMPEGDKKTN
jgi:hypothetical protein